jgi:hypothetical protein
MVNSTLSGKEKGDVTIIYRTVRWVNGASGQRSSAQSTRDTWSAPTVSWAHRTVRRAPDSVRCANSPEGPTVGCVRYGRRSRTGPLQWLSGGAPESPVHHSIEGKKCLPSWSLTAPSCLGAIKGTPRHMEQDTKPSLSILRLTDSASTHLIDCVSDLSSVWVANSLCCVSSSSLGLCVGVLRIWVLRVLLFHPYSCAFFVTYIVRVRGSNLWRFLANGKNTQKRKDCGIQVDHWITWKGLSATLVQLGRHNVEVGKCYLVEPQDKNRVSLLWLFCLQEIAS